MIYIMKVYHGKFKLVTIDYYFIYFFSQDIHKDQHRFSIFDLLATTWIRFEIFEFFKYNRIFCPKH